MIKFICFLIFLHLLRCVFVHQQREIDRLNDRVDDVESANEKTETWDYY